jgi:hypothetical protein
MNVLKINIAKWIEKEIAQTEYQLLRAEDEAADAALRVKALQQRLTRLRAKTQVRLTKKAREALAAEMVPGTMQFTVDTTGYEVPRRARFNVWPIKNFGGNKS